jgi:hypothetical protein
LHLLSSLFPLFLLSGRYVSDEGNSLDSSAHEIRNEIIEEIEKEEKICHLKRKEKHKGIPEKEAV